MVFIYCKETTPRINYTVHLIFSEVLGISFDITNDLEVFKNSSETKVNYSKSRLLNCLTIDPEGLLDESDLVHHDIKLGKWNNLPIFFNRETGDLPFDLFSAVFYLVSRYEEYLPFRMDTFGRFEADQSLASRGNFLNIPMVDFWCFELAKLLGIYQLCKNILPDHYSFQLTIDIDHAWVYKHKGIFYFTGSFIKNLFSLNFRKMNERIQVYLNRSRDPADTYKYLNKVQIKLSEKIKYFILCGKKDTYDKNIPIRNKNFQKLIKKLDDSSFVGLHPSFASNESFRILEKELHKLVTVLHRKIKISRQHFLKLKLPDTYRNLIRLGIAEDYTMGYSSKTGFRAGIARPFYFYDLYEEKQTSLRIVPFQIMDRTLLSYLNYSPEMAKKEFDYYLKTIKSIGGQFVGLWHNTSLSDFEEWKGWKEVFEYMINLNSINDKVPEA